MVDIFGIFLNLLEQELQFLFFYIVGKFYLINNEGSYECCINVVNFVFDNDDGVCVCYYDEVDLILVGVLCSGKIFICLYLVLQYGIKVVNYLIIEEDLLDQQMLVVLKFYKYKIFGFIIEFECLVMICNEWWFNFCYFFIKQCMYEIEEIELMYWCECIFYFNIIVYLVEEIFI